MVEITDALIRALSQDDPVLANLKQRGLLSGEFEQTTASSADEQLANILSRGLALQRPAEAVVPITPEGPDAAPDIVGEAVAPETSVIAKAVQQVSEGDGGRDASSDDDTHRGEIDVEAISKAISDFDPGAFAEKAIDRALGQDEEGAFADTGSTARQVGKVSGVVSKLPTPLALPATIVEGLAGIGEISELNKELDALGLPSIGIGGTLHAMLSPFSDLRDIAQNKVNKAFQADLSGLLANAKDKNAAARAIAEREAELAAAVAKANSARAAAAARRNQVRGGSREGGGQATGEGANVGRGAPGAPSSGGFGSDIGFA
jgi:hypothetical protein